MTNTTRLRMLPVCECGYVFQRGIDTYEEVIQPPGGITLMKYMVYGFDPPVCPNCNKTIEAIEYLKEGFKW